MRYTGGDDTHVSNLRSNSRVLMSTTCRRVGYECFCRGGECIPLLPKSVTPRPVGIQAVSYPPSDRGIRTVCVIGVTRFTHMPIFQHTLKGDGRVQEISASQPPHGNNIYSDALSVQR